jgi:hypothetical protein
MSAIKEIKLSDVGRRTSHESSGIRHSASDRFCFALFVQALFLFTAIPFAYSADELRDIRGPVALRPDLWPWLILGLALIVGVVWLVLARVKWQGRKAPVAPPRPAWEIALAGLNDLEKRKLLSEGRYKEYYSLLSDIVRNYIEARFEIRAPEMTTEEFLNYSYASEKLNDRQKKFLRDLLQSSDMVKFARFIPQMDQARESLRLARSFIEETRTREQGVVEEKGQ